MVESRGDRCRGDRADATANTTARLRFAPMSPTVRGFIVERKLIARSQDYLLFESLSPIGDRVPFSLWEVESQ
jgi:hypothetical protein